MVKQSSSDSTAAPLRSPLLACNRNEFVGEAFVPASTEVAPLPPLMLAGNTDEALMPNSTAEAPLQPLSSACNKKKLAEDFEPREFASEDFQKPSKRAKMPDWRRIYLARSGGKFAKKSRR